MELLSASPDERLGRVEDRLREHAAAVLRLPAARIDLDQPLVTMGIDWLMAVELKSRVQRELGIEIPLLQLIKGPSLSELARTFIGAMTGETVPSSESERKKRVVPEASGKSLLLSMLSLKDPDYVETP